MASSAGFLEYVRDQIGLGDALGWRKMFGEYALYLDERMVALVCDDMLYVKPTDAGRALLDDVDEVPPFPGAKLWWRMDELLDDGEQLRRLLRATAAALPPPKARKPAGPRKRR